MVLAVCIFVMTLVLVIWQPKGLGIGWSAVGGAVLALVTGVVHLSDVPTVWGIVWNATVTFVAVIIISLILDEAGTFEWAALHVARWGRGDARRLFNLIVVLGAAIAALFANDGAALILTPIVFQMLLALRWTPRAAFAFVIATGFVADTTSLPLVVSNLVNIVSADFFGLSFARYALVMVPVALVSLGASLVVLRWYFRKSIPDRYDVADLAAPSEVIHDALTFHAGWVVLAVLLTGYFAADSLGVPIAAVAALCAAVLALVAARRPARVFARPSLWLVNRAAAEVGQAASAPAVLEVRDGEGGGRGPDRGVVVLEQLADAAPIRANGPGPATGSIQVGQIVRSAPWQIVLFSLGMYLVVYGLRNQGLTDALGRVFTAFGNGGTLAAGGATGFLVAGMSSVMNNMPTVLVAALGVHSAAATGLIHEVMVYATVIGADLGPKITPIGSLATLLWLHVLDRKGMHIGWGRYFRIGITLTVPVLAITLLALAGWLTVLGAV